MRASPLGVGAFPQVLTSGPVPASPLGVGAFPQVLTSGARGVDEEALARVRSPAGLDLGPLPQPEIAVAVLAELVAWRHARDASPTELLEAVDPVCGMTVAVGPDTPNAEHGHTTYWFCCPGCRSRFTRDPAAFLAVTD